MIKVTFWKSDVDWYAEIGFNMVDKGRIQFYRGYYRFDVLGLYKHL